MKSTGSQYIEAIRRHFNRGKKQWLRTIHIISDEEIGATDGMQKFVNMPEFRELNLGFMLDEGLATEGSAYKQSIINSALAFREEQRAILKSDPSKRLGDVITVNLTKVEGVLDIRLPPNADFKEMDKRLADWCKKAGPGVTCRFLIKNEFLNMTSTASDDPFWAAFVKSMKDEKCEFEKDIFPGSTDSRFVRKLGYRSIGFSPMNNTPSLLHDHNEYLNEAVYLRGVKIYETLIDNLASVESS
ncbi:N-acyl-L-amino-acid amidohydrolase [Oesophagostomum dentatum]|uniref:N-acyl-L-amino-acid amidohydrolase n=1 Tax=Oesophagostomum dentatum TaxID=61180 RepID=A0A0B1S8T7_OESDE|nr:N-acyl-L-amino-acid amidohydrolase [Oesophagostomum dentatum]